MSTVYIVREPLLAVRADGIRGFVTLEPKSTVTVESGRNEAGLVLVACDGEHYRVFEQDLADRALVAAADRAA